jgi:glycosyltransferase involved in cell wall biosynthesis
MRALLVIREDAQRTLGGDTIQMLKTRAVLETLGLTVEVRGTDELDDLPACDIAHVFNIQTAESSWAAFKALQERGVPTVLSSIYWDTLEHWSESAVVYRLRWRWLARLLGKARARQVYITWQRQKAPITPKWRIQHRLLEQALRVLPNSQSEADLLQRTFALDGSFQHKIDVVPNGVDSDLFQPPPPPNRAFQEKYGVRDFVLEVGAISPVKNQLGLIEALYDLPVPLVFIGQPAPAMPEYAGICRARAAKRGNVVFVDRLPHEELPGIYALATVHALPSWRETPGLVSLEAAAAGCRVVTTSIGSTRDYFGDWAWYCYPGDQASIRVAVEAALRAPSSDALRQRVLTEFTWQRAGEATLASYRAALDQR